MRSPGQSMLAREYQKTVTELLSHATMSITFDTYNHTTPAMHKEAARKLDTLLTDPGELEAQQ